MKAFLSFAVLATLFLSACNSQLPTTQNPGSMTELSGSTTSCDQQSPRNPALWPFSSNSPWNTPIGSGAVFESISSPGFNPRGLFWINIRDWSHPIFINKSSDPLRKIYQKNSWGKTLIAQIRVPNTAKQAIGYDAHLHIIDSATNRVVEMYQAKKLLSGDWQATDVIINDLKDQGIYPEWHGVRAYGGSAIAGLIRKNEMKNGIFHALAMAVQRESMNVNGPVWPASAQDSGAQGTYATSGNLYMGSLLALPADVNINQLGIPANHAAMKIIQAMQDYGLYIVDATSDEADLSAEPAALTDFPSDTYLQVKKALPYLKIVANNSQNSVGGGGLPRTCLAPPFLN